MKILNLFTLLICALLASCSNGEFYETKKFDKTFYAIDTNIIKKPKIIKKNDLNYEVSEYYNESDQFPYLIFSEHISQNDTINISNYYFQNTKKIKIQEKVTYSKNSIIDSCKSYYENGNIKREAVIENYKTTYDRSYDSIGNIITPKGKKDFFSEPNVNIKSIASCITYPEHLRKKSCEARVLLYCFVNKNGIVEKIEYDSDHYEDFVTEARLCVLNYEIKPAILDDIPIDCWITIPISFKLR